MTSLSLFHQCTHLAVTNDISSLYLDNYNSQYNACRSYRPMDCIVYHVIWHTLTNHNSLPVLLALPSLCKSKVNVTIYPFSVLYLKVMLYASTTRHTPCVFVHELVFWHHYTFTSSQYKQSGDTMWGVTVMIILIFKMKS